MYVGYRLGILGSSPRTRSARTRATTADGPAGGARWVKENIARFSGNGHDVTIFGGSAGGASVWDQVASPTAKGLFQRGISISGFYNFNVNTIWSPTPTASPSCRPRPRPSVPARSSPPRSAADTRATSPKRLRSVPSATLVKKAGTGPRPRRRRHDRADRERNDTACLGGAGVRRGQGQQGAADDRRRRGRAQRRRVHQRSRPFRRRQQSGAIPKTRPQQWGLRAQGDARIRAVPEPSPFIAYRTIIADAFSVCPALHSFGELSATSPCTPTRTTTPTPRAEVPGHAAARSQPHSDQPARARLPSSLDPNQLVLQNQVLTEWAGFAGDGDPTPSRTPAVVPPHGGRAPGDGADPGGDSTRTRPLRSGRTPLRFLGRDRPLRPVGGARRLTRHRRRRPAAAGGSFTGSPAESGQSDPEPERVEHPGRRRRLADRHRQPTGGPQLAEHRLDERAQGHRL